MRELFRDTIAAVVALATTHQYLVLFAIIAIEEAGVPLPAPGDLVIAYFGWRTRGDPYEIAQVVLACALGSTVGTLVPYALARRFGHGVALRLARWLDVDPRHVEALNDRVARDGFAGVFVGRLIPGLRVAVSLVAGTARVRIVEFSAAVFLAAAVYWSGWVALGVLVGPRIERLVGPTYIRIVVFLIPIVVIAVFVGRIVYARRRAAAPHQR